MTHRHRHIISLLPFSWLSCTSHAQLNSGNLTQFTEKDGLPGAAGPCPPNGQPWLFMDWDHKWPDTV